MWRSGSELPDHVRAMNASSPPTANVHHQYCVDLGIGLVALECPDNSQSISDFAIAGVALFASLG
jgi:hypothetical protein